MKAVLICSGCGFMTEGSYTATIDGEMTDFKPDICPRCEAAQMEIWEEINEEEEYGRGE
jgi:hypothetical protein